MLLIALTALSAVLLVCDGVPTPTNAKDGGSIGELPENWDQTKDDTQSLFLNKSDKNDLEPYPLALSEEGNVEGYEQGVEQRFDSPQSTGELDNLIMRPELYGEPPAMEGLSSGYDSRRRKRGSGTKVGGAGAATKVATKSGSGKKNLKSEEHDALSPIDSASHDKDAHRRKRGSGTKVGGAAASAKTATKNSGGNKKNFRPISERRKRDSGLSAADVRALLNLWEAQERRKQEWNANQWAADRYYGRVNTVEDEQPEVDENELSETSLDVNIPSYTGSPRSLNYGSKSSLKSDEEHEPKLKRAVSFLLEDNNFLVAAETGNDKLLEIIIRKGTNIQQQDYLGRNALHLAVCAGNKRAIIILLDAGVNANVKDNVGMTPLSLCLMRRPSLDIANLLFDHGAVIVPRSNPVDTGLFLQFVMMCKPTYEEARILKLLVEKGALVNDPEAPGGRQALHFAAMSNNCVLIHILLDLGANMHLTNHRHETPKDVAITYKCRDTLTLLQEFEAN